MILLHTDHVGAGLVRIRKLCGTPDAPLFPPRQVLARSLQIRSLIARVDARISCFNRISTRAGKLDPFEIYAMRERAASMPALAF